ncbi:MAG: hypothetical protein APF80_16355 [Alphaproteobacteria bacterium BRH_c36]|nr:MAG: hypothetical protein APF80_16355 [Alphaproteobacteria bacterium BRH_c36]
MQCTEPNVLASQQAGSPFRRRGAAAGFAVVLTLSLCGCGMPSLTSGFGSSILGGGASSAKVDSITEEQLLSAAKADVNGGAGSLSTGAIAHGCPEFIPEVREGSVTIYEDGRVGDGLAIKHRGEITKTARECIVEPGRVTVKYGFSGRVLLGPRGQSGSTTFPINVFVTDAKRERVAADVMEVAVDLSVDNPISYFSAVRTITFDVAQGARPGEYKMHVAFDRKVPGAG